MKVVKANKMAETSHDDTNQSRASSGRGGSRRGRDKSAQSRTLDTEVSQVTMATEQE